MILISHRGNTAGSSPEQENKPHYIETAIYLGYDVEIDIWGDGVQFWLGHNQPDTLIDQSFLYKHIDKLWCHAKSAIVLKELMDLNMHCFFHDQDNMTLTSKNYIWVYPTYKYLNGYCIIVHPEKYGVDFRYAAGVCSDYVDNIKRSIE